MEETYDYSNDYDTDYSVDDYDYSFDDTGTILYTTEATTYGDINSFDMGAFIATYSTVMIIISVFFIIVMWRIFSKAGRKGILSIVPIYNLVVLFQIAGLKGWQVILLFIPLVNIVFEFILCIKLAKAFGKGTGFGIGLVFLAPIFFPILAFGKSQYVLGEQNNNEMPTNQDVAMQTTAEPQNTFTEGPKTSIFDEQAQAAPSVETPTAVPATPQVVEPQVDTPVVPVEPTPQVVEPPMEPVGTNNQNPM